MKHLIPFLEARLYPGHHPSWAGSPVNDKKTISLNTYGLVNYLPDIFGLAIGIRFSKHVDCIIKNNFTEDPNRNKNPRYLDNIKNPQITMRFKDLIDVTKMSKHLKSNFTNKFSVKDKTITIDVENVEVKTNFIEEHKEDIEDALIEFQDMEYIMEYDDGNMDNYNESDPFDAFMKNYGRKEIPITTYHISIMTKDDREEDEDNYDDVISDITRLKSEEDFVKNKNLYSKTLSAIKRLQSYNLKVIYQFNTFKNFDFLVICDKDEFFDDIPLI